MLTFAALADPTRRHILELLSRGERSAGEIAAEFDVSGPAISQHLKLLREASLVRVRVDAQRRIYGLDPAGLGEVEAWLGQVHRFWAARLDVLDQELRREGPPRPAAGRKRSKR